MARQEGGANAQVFQMRRAAAVESSYAPGIAALSVDHETNTLLQVLLDSAILSVQNTENESDEVTAWFSTVGVSHVSVKHRMLQSLVSPVTVH